MLSLGSHQPDLWTFFSLLLSQFSLFSCFPPTQQAFSGQGLSAGRWSSVVAQLVSLICCDATTSASLQSQAVKLRLKVFSWKDTHCLPSPNGSNPPFLCPITHHAQCIFLLSDLSQHFSAYQERGFLREVSVAGVCGGSDCSGKKHIILERTFPWRFPAKFSFRFSQYWNEPQIISCRVQFPEIWAY